jgi:hypothetical protein
MNKLVEILMEIKYNEFEKFKMIMKHMIYLLDPKSKEKSENHDL